jgi:hypothetical protein
VDPNAAALVEEDEEEAVVVPADGGTILEETIEIGIDRPRRRGRWVEVEAMDRIPREIGRIRGGTRGRGMIRGRGGMVMEMMMM